MISKALNDVLTRIVTREPFFRRILLECVYKEDMSIPTACVTPNGEFIINPKWFEKLTSNEKMFVVLHEILHIALLHLLRKKEPVQIWNIATDLAINSFLEYAGFDPDRLEVICVFPKHFGFEENLSEEEYFRLLIQNKEKVDKVIDKIMKQSSSFYKNIYKGSEKSDNQEGKMNSDQKGDEVKKGVDHENIDSSKKQEDIVERKSGIENYKGFDEHKYDERKISNDEKKKIIDKYRRVLISASKEMKRGKFPGWFKSLIEELENPKVNWKELLRKFVKQTVKTKEDWRRPNKRYLPYNIILPSKYQKILNLVIAIDTSGSISDEDLKEFVSEVNAIMKSFEAYNILLIQNDTKIQYVREIRYPDTLRIEDLKMRGRGGTDFRPVFRYLDEKRIRYPVVFFTDLDGVFPDWRVNQQVLWIALSDIKPPFGVVVRYRNLKFEQFFQSKVDNVFDICYPENTCFFIK